MITKLDPPSVNLDLVREPELSVLMIYADGCKHCQTIKPVYEELEKQYSESMNFFMVDINHSLEFYEMYAEVDDFGKVKYIIPSFYIFHREAQSPENEFGFIGGIDGANTDELIATLELIESELLNQ